MQTSPDGQTDQSDGGERQTQSGQEDDPLAMPFGDGSVRTAGLRVDVAFKMWRHSCVLE